MVLPLACNDQQNSAGWKKNKTGEIDDNQMTKMWHLSSFHGSKRRRDEGIGFMHTLAMAITTREEE